MLAWWILVILLAEGGANTSGGDIPDHQDILKMQDRWKEYRNIVRGGFFFNDTVIVMADYSDDDRDFEDGKSEESEIKEAEFLENTELLSNVKETEVPKEYLGDGKDSRDILKVLSHINIFGCKVNFSEWF